MAKRIRVGQVAPNRIPVVDHRGNVRGAVTERATQSTAARFLGRQGATLGIHEGRKAWIGPKPPTKPKS